MATATALTDYIDALFADLEAKYPVFATTLKWANEQTDKIVAAVAANLGTAGVLLADAVLQLLIDGAAASGHMVLAGVLKMIKALVDQVGPQNLPKLTLA